MTRKTEPLTGLEYFLYPITYRLFPQRRQELALRADARLAKLLSDQEWSKAKKQITREIRLFGILLIETLARLGAQNIQRAEAGSGRRSKVKKVQFQVVRAEADVIYYKVLVSKKTYFSATTALPYGVSVADIYSDIAQKDMAFALERSISVKWDEARKGLWILVYRNVTQTAIPALVNFNDLIAYYPEDSSGAPVLLGVGEHRIPHVVKFGEHPHALIGGSSGSGKSNMVNNLICQFMRFHSPDDLKLILVDLKEMEFVYYADSPHLMRPIIENADETIVLLEELAEMISKRARILKGKAKELGSFNKRYPSKKMPRIVVIIDEFAELVAASGKEIAADVKTLIMRITNKGRAVGIHLIICTQRPATQIVGNEIKINCDLVVAGRTVNGDQSRVIIDVTDAAYLPKVPGRMLYKSKEGIQQIQTPYIDDETVMKSVAISKGLGLGLIKIDGLHYSIVSPIAVDLIWERFGGRLSPSLIISYLKDFGIELRTLTIWAKNIIQAGEVVGNFGKYKVVLTDRAYHLEMIEDYRTEPDTEPIIVEVIKEEPRLLPAPNPDKAEEWIEVAVTPVQASAPKPVKAAKNKRSHVQAFVEERCTVDKASDEKIKIADLYSAYTEFCQEQKITPLSINMFGRELTKLGIVNKRSSQGEKIRTGIKLNNEQVALNATV